MVFIEKQGGKAFLSTCTTTSGNHGFGNRFLVRALPEPGEDLWRARDWDFPDEYAEGFLTRWAAMDWCLARIGAG